MNIVRKIKNRICSMRDSIAMHFAVNKARRSYASKLSALKKEVGSRKLKVIFLVSEISKWKCESLFAKLSGSKIFEPAIALTMSDTDFITDVRRRKEHMKENLAYFKAKGVPFVEAYDVERDEARDLRLFSPDIVFYQHSWNYAPPQRIGHVSRFALTCYVPYYLICFDAPWMDAEQQLHRLVFRYFLINSEWAGHLRSFLKGKRTAGEWIGAGHPMLDNLVSVKGENPDRDFIIYAPHWSVPVENGFLERYSTFLENGDAILKYAQEHKEFKWCFKPHPTLRVKLEKCDGWDKKRIDKYFSDWEKLGAVCSPHDYVGIFKKARAMITDSSSFLMEFSAMDKPLIRLVSSECRFSPAKPSEPLFESFYQVHDMDEMYSAFKLVLENRLDPKAKMRHEAISKLNLLHSDAAGRIAAHLEALFVGK